ncbi:MAG: hypothetical protein WCK35_08355 [Chloroflexota bacterium]
MLKKSLVVIGALIVMIAVLAACAPAATPAPTEAPVVPTAVPATEVPTAVPPTAVPTVDPKEAIMPIFAASGHADAKAMAFTDWDAEKEVPAACARCHTGAGFQEYVANGKVAAGMPVPNKPFDCATCHANDLDKNLRSVTFPSGVEIKTEGPEAICMTCHQGRESKISVDAKIEKFGIKDVDAQVAPLVTKDAAGKETKSSFGFSNVHYFAAGGTLYAGEVHMGYEYEGNVYDIKTQHVDGFNTCLGCHDQHSLKVKVDKCSECHEGVKTVEDLQNVREPSSSKDYNGNGDVKEGIAKEIEGLQAVLMTTIQAYANEVAGTPIVYDAAAYPYWFVADKDGKAALDKDGKTTGYNKWTARMLKAAYNYQVSVKDPGAFAHGGKYIIELIYDSTADLNAAAKLKTKTDMTKLVREDAGHFNGAAAAWRHWDTNADGAFTYEVEAGCTKCHSANGLPTMLAGKEAAAQPAGNGLMCKTCHDLAAFPARLAAKDVTLPSGKVVSFGDNADSNLCIECHQARASKKSIDKKISDFAVTDLDAVVGAITVDGKEQAFSFINSHYLGIAGVWFGTDAQIAYEYDGKTYLGANKHIAVDNKPGCVGCHDVHAGTPKVELCKTCHGDVAVDDIRGMSSTADYNGNGDTKEGIRQEYRALRDVLYTEIQKYAKAKGGTPIFYDVNTYPYWFVATADGKAALVKDGKTTAYNTFTARLLKATYNFNFLRKNPGAAVHNGKYVIQILIDSIEDLGGDISKYTRP